MNKSYLCIGSVILAVAVSSCTSPKQPAGPKTGTVTTPGPKPATPSQVTSNSAVIPYLTPAQEAKTFDIRDGYKLELVLSDPIIKEPTVVAFDGNGRMYVAEMRTYMQDIDGRDEHAPKSRVSLHWSSKHNGVYDKHTVFADNLVLPRMILPLADGVLINETDTDDIYLYRDTKGTGVADKKVLWHAGGGRGGNLEHQPSGLIWDLDNWLYMAVNSYRLRIKGTNVVSENIPSGGGQWGICQDDYGKPWVVNAGFEVGPWSYHVPILYGDFFWGVGSPFPAPEFAEVWPLVGIADYQGGLVRVRPGDKTLNHFTGTCGPDIFRGDRLPADLRGDLLFAEPVGRLIRRAKVLDNEGFTVLTNAYYHSEFIRSTDPNFRPVNLTTAPDGTVYLVDMYRGIIQESAWVNQGSYLRDVVQRYQLDKNFGRGRIWRLVHPGYKPGPQPRMLDEKPAQLVKHLEHPNGWWRDTAQKLIILHGDKSVVPALVKLARSSANHLGRIHAIWTLEGLDALEPDLVREKLKDPHPQVRVAAIRASETLYKAGDHSLLPDIFQLANDPAPSVVIQVMVSANLYKWPGWDKMITSTIATNPAYGVKKIGGHIAPPPAAAIASAPAAPKAAPFSSEQKQVLAHGEEIYKSLCFACHAPDGTGAPLAGGKPGATLAPPLGGSKTITGHLDNPISVVLKGLSGPVNGKAYDAQMVPMESNDDAWVAAVLSYIRNNFGNHSTFVSTNDVARVRAAIKGRTNAWTLEELHDTWAQPLTNRQQWKLTASHNAGALPLAVDGDLATRYDTQATQTPGMWVQVELPEETEITGVELDSGASEQDYARGYKVELSKDGADWGQPVANGNATAIRNEVVFPPARAKFIRITQTGSDPSYFWSIHELQVLKVAAPREPPRPQPQVQEPPHPPPAEPPHLPQKEPLHPPQIEPDPPASGKDTAALN